jgi:rhamnopyranosyl-N-acetylglucosaminyl-diphospho-decaprenol beta-1,3/1,4-galactofuranosyltransferase
VQATDPKVAIAIVTYNRSGMLSGLLASIERLAKQPELVIIVDNASGDDTAAAVGEWAARYGLDRVLSRRMETNTGGSGGFSECVRLAIEAGVDWVWLMDDDVEVLPEALNQFAPWMRRFKVIHGRRYDTDGSPFYWQAKFNNFLGVPLPFSSRHLNTYGYAVTNSGTFEGMLIATEIATRIGLPDPRFFITWDDATYAWLAAQITEVALVDEFVMQKKRPQRQVNLGLRHLNDASPMVKYHFLRNRAYVGRYFQVHGKLNRFGFALGTGLTFAKEVFRLIVVEHHLTGFDRLVDGWRDGRKIWADPDWQPMPPVLAGPTSRG